MKLHVVVLAAGPGTRMRSERQKVLLEANGLPLLEYVLRAAARLQPESTTVVVGRGAEDVGRYLAAWPEVNVVLQDPARGAMHAVSKTEALLWDAEGLVLVLPGSAAAVVDSHLHSAVAHHQASGNATTMILGKSQSMWGFDSVLDGSALKSLEFGLMTTNDDASTDPVGSPSGSLAFSGVAVFGQSTIFGLVTEICRSNPDSADIGGIASASAALGQQLGGWVTPEADSLRAARTREELMLLGRLLRQRRCQSLMDGGVSLIDPETTFIGCDVEVGHDSVIHPNVYLEGRTVIGSNCVVHSGSRLVDAVMEDKVVVLNHTIIESSRVESGASVGPFAHIRPGSTVGENARVGNFVELKKTALGAGSKASHLSYLGDAQIGSRVNIGAGTITCNYDGVHKHQTIIEDDVFIGSDSQLVAPVTIEHGAYVAAGSSITKSVPAGALGIARGRQENKWGWVARMRDERGSGGHS